MGKMSGLIWRQHSLGTATSVRTRRLFGCVVLGLLGAPLQATAHTLDLLARALRYDAHSGLVYAIVASDGIGPYGDRLVAISSSTGTVVASRDLGAGASSLAISPDVPRAYVGYRSAHLVRPVDLQAMTLGTPFSVGPTMYVEDVAVMPGSPDTVAVALAEGESGFCGSVTVYSVGVQGATTRQNACNAIAFGDDPGQLYAYDRYDSDSWVVRDAISTTSIVVEDFVLRGLPAFMQSIRARGDIVYSSGGVALDGATLHPVGQYAAEGPFAFDDANEAVVYFDGAYARLFDRNAFVPRITISLDVRPGAHAVDASDCGHNCVAAAYDSGQVAILPNLIEVLFANGFEPAPFIVERHP